METDVGARHATNLTLLTSWLHIIEGSQAATEGLQSWNNPHPKDSENAEYWLRGWSSCRVASTVLPLGRHIGLQRIDPAQDIRQSINRSPSRLTLEAPGEELRQKLTDLIQGPKMSLYTDGAIHTAVTI